jgi:hypothetical protein
MHQVNAESRATLGVRTTFVEGVSPDVVASARLAAGGPFDFVFVDGDHATASVFADAMAAWPHVADGGRMLFHDAFNSEVHEAIEAFLVRQAATATDCGFMTNSRVVDGPPAEPVYWGGLRLLARL